jgi:hypothetical protein
MDCSVAQFVIHWNDLALKSFLSTRVLLLVVRCSVLCDLRLHRLSTGLWLLLVPCLPPTLVRAPYSALS